MPERIAEESWRFEKGHVDRYTWASGLIWVGETVLDIACGIGYGAELLAPTRCQYYGVDKPGVPSPTFNPYGTFIERDIDHWRPSFSYDVAISFETLEHVGNLRHLVSIVSQAKRLLLVSVPTVPTVHMNEFHVRDFTQEDIPALFPEWKVRQVWEQPADLSHVWAFER
jgi:cyclopropane fatty-acyl-phospholipid synthase-like methyltransferase